MNREQLKTIFWLRWRLMRNQWRRTGGVGIVLAVVVAGAAIALAGLTFVGGVAAGAFAMRDVNSENIRWVWFGITLAFLVFWLIGLLSELQRSESIDLQRLMHLPVALGQMFCINYVVSHLTLSIIMVVPAMLGLTIGLAASHGLIMLLLAPLGLSMVLMITAWTYCLRGWLAAMMNNPRRRRAIIMGLTLCFVMLAQAPNLYFNVLRRFHKSSGSQTEARKVSGRHDYGPVLKRLMGAQKFIPPLWVPLGAEALAKQNPAPAIGAMLGCTVIGALGLRRAYRTTLRFYYGETSKKAEVAGKSQTELVPTRKPARFLELTVPWVPEQATAVATATLRSFLRAPEVKIAWATSFLVTLIVGASVLFSANSSKVPPAVKPFAIIAPMGFSLLMLLQFLANQFGFDRDGFRSLVLSPVDRRLVLLGKNLAILPVAACSSGLLLGLTAVWLRLPLIGVAAACFQLAALLLLGGLGSNLLSILVPYRIQPGSMKPTKMPALSVLLMVLCHMLYPLVLAPVLVAPLAELIWNLAGLPTTVPVNLLLSIMLVLLLAFIYWQTLKPMGRLLQRREITILGKVTQEVE